MGEAVKIREAVQKNECVCKRSPGFCRDCRESQALIDGVGEMLYPDFKFKKDVYFLDRTKISIGLEEAVLLQENTDDPLYES